MSYKKVFPEEDAAKIECIGRLTTESFKFWKLSELAMDAHNWDRSKTYQNMGDIIWAAREACWESLMRDTKKHLDHCIKLNEEFLAMKAMKGGEML